MNERCVKVPKKNGQMAKEIMIEKNMIRDDVLMRAEGEHLYIPLKDDIKHIDEGIFPFDVDMVKMELERKLIRPRSYKELVDMDPSLKQILPSSYDILGELCIIKLPEPLMLYKYTIARSLMEFNRNIRKVSVDRGVKGEFRIRDLELIGGEGDLEVTHVENNLRFRLNPSLVYFSPRLATERMRIATQIEDERVLDMFAGVGPFSLNIARHGKPVNVTGIDMNPDCYRYFKINISLNGLDDIVEPVFGDSLEIVPTLSLFDRVIMNLPHSSFDFLKTAIDALGANGQIHIYSIVERSELKKTLEKIITDPTGSKRGLKINGVREVHNYSPTQSMMGIDIIVE